MYEDFESFPSKITLSLDSNFLIINFRVSDFSSIEDDCQKFIRYYAYLCDGPIEAPTSLKSISHNALWHSNHMYSKAIIESNIKFDNCKPIFKLVLSELFFKFDCARDYETDGWCTYDVFSAIQSESYKYVVLYFQNALPTPVCILLENYWVRFSGLVAEKPPIPKINTTQVPEKTAENPSVDTLYDGFIYVLTHSKMPNLVKIGMTTQTVEERVSSLNSKTAVPGPFTIEYTKPFNDLSTIESMIHHHFSEKRIPRTEFFELHPSDVISFIKKLDSPPSKKHKKFKS